MNGIGSFLPLVILVGVMYLVLIRPQQQRVKAQRALVTSLAVGDEVITIGGMLGRIVTIDDEVATVETTPGTILRFRRTAIAGRTDAGQPAGPTGPAGSADEDEV
jgi:preprotein translocase subunit YajC